jgi:hypothetical protein
LYGFTERWHPQSKPNLASLTLSADLANVRERGNIIQGTANLDHYRLTGVSETDPGGGAFEESYTELILQTSNAPAHCRAGKTERASSLGETSRRPSCRQICEAA